LRVQRAGPTSPNGSGWRAAAAPLVGVVALIGVEAGLFARGHVLAGDIADAAIVVALLNVGRDPKTRGPSTRVTVTAAASRALAFVALIRVVALGLPLRNGSSALGTLVVAALVGIPAILASPYMGVSLLAMGAARFSPRQLRRAVTGLVAIVVGGLALGLLAYLVGAPALWAAGVPRTRALAALVAACAAALTEEVLFRGLVQVTLQRMVGGAGVLAASALFASTYLSVRPVALILTVALAGLLFGVAVAWTGSLRGAVLGHVMFVVAAGAVWPTLLGRTHPPRLPELGTTIALSVALAVVAVIALLRPVEAAPAPATEPSRRAPLREDEVLAAVTPNRGPGT
jgi:membrane protease YdiL (CAAX protease family)